MKKTHSAFWYIFCLLLASSAAAQESTNSQGGDLEGSGGKVSYSVGQIFHPLEGNLEGIQQAYEVTIITSANNGTEDLVGISIFPNPVSHILTIKKNTSEKTALEFILSNSSGAVIEEGKFSQDETPLNMKDLPAAVYFLNIIIENSVVRTYKIIKN